MKKICAAIVVLLSIMLLAPVATAQKYVPAPVEISKSVVTVDGKQYYEHTVVAKQTLYSICQAYGVDLTEVTVINLDKVENGLKIGTVLLIPYGGVASSQATADKAGDGQGAKAAEKSVDVPQPEDSAVAEPKEQDDAGQKYIMHRVRWYDSMLMLSLKYKVSQDEIVKLNNLDSKTLVVGSMLKIPVKGDTDQVDDNTIIVVDEGDDFEDDSDYSGTVTITDEGDDRQQEEEEIQVIPFSGTARIALILPLAAASDAPSDNFLDFYSGVLMALNRIKTSGINVNLKVVDMADYDSFDELLGKNNLYECDFIIGHFPIETIDAVADFCDENRIPLISPMDQKIEAATYRHPYLVNVPLSAATQALRLAESIEYDSAGDNVIVLCENGENTGQFHADVIASLEKLEIPYHLAQSGIGRNGSGNVSSLLSAGKKNHIIITSEKESLASDAIRNTGLLGRGGKNHITGYASQKVRRFDSIEQASFQNMNAHFCLGYYVDYTDENVRNFVRQYRALYNAEPTPYAFQGYDIAIYFVDALSVYGSGMINGIAECPGSGLQLNFGFDRRNSGGGMFNEATRNIIYEDGSISLLK